MARRPRLEPIRPSAYESLIDAEREALVQAGRTPRRSDLVRALRSAAPDLPSRAVARAVDRYIDDRGGLIPATSPVTDARRGWIDGLIDAERGRAAREDRPLSLRTLRRILRQATPELTPRARREALADYLHRRGGHPVTKGRWRLVALLTLAFAAIALMIWAGS